MFNGMMDPELMRMAQEQMSRMSPAELARIQEQMMSNPELIRMASESMQKLRPEDFKKAAEQLKHTRPEEMADIGEKMAKASPEELASMKARIDAKMYYETNAAEMLKKQGNDLHSQGKYENALEKYTRAKNNLEGMPTSKGRNLLLACSLNMMSCYLKTKQYEDCIQQGTEVLTYDANNVKALYRRGQAYKELGQLRDAVFDLRKAHEVSPEDETIAEVLRDAEERFIEEGGVHRSRGLVIEEITEEATILSNTPEYPSSELPSQELPSQETSEDKIFQTSKIGEVQSTSTNQLETLKNNPESIRSFQNFSHRADSETLTGINGGKVEAMSPEMLKTASDAISKMSPEELQKMFQLASSFQAENTFIKNSPNFSSAPILSDLSPDMLKTAGDMVAKMSPEDLQKMFEMMSSLKKDGVPSSSADLHSNRGPIPSNVSPDMLKMATEMMGKMSPEDRKSMFGMASSLKGLERRAPSASTSYSNSDSLRNRGNPVVDDSNSASPLSSCLNSSNVDVQEQMRNQMQDPAMRQMFTSMIKNMNPEMMANMSEQFGFKLSREDAEKAQQAMSSLSPDALDRMMKWADRVQRGVEGARKTKNWLLGRPGMILAISMLLLAVIFHWLGFIGK